MTEVTAIVIPAITDAYNPEIGVETYLQNAHKAFEALVSSLESGKSQATEESAKVRKDLSGSVNLDDMGNVERILSETDSFLEELASDDPNLTLYIVEQLEDMLSYWRKYANFVVDAETSKRNRATRRQTVDVEEVKAQAVQLRTEMDSVLIFCSATGVDIPDDIPTKDKSGVTTYGGELPKGIGTGSAPRGRAATTARLVITHNGEPIETYTRRKIQEIIFRRINPVLGTRFSKTADIEEFLGIDSISQTPWELSDDTGENVFRCETVKD